MKTKEPYPDKHYPDGLTFEDALRYHDEDLVRHLIRKGLDPNRRSKDGKPLLLAAKDAGAFRVVEALQKAGASPDVCNKAGIPALVVAAARGHTEVVYELLCYGATPELPPHLLHTAGGEGKLADEILRLIRCFHSGRIAPKKAAE